MLQHTISQCFSWNAEDRFPFIPSWVTGLWQWFFRQLLSGQQQSEADAQPWEFLGYSSNVVMAGLRLQGFKPFAMVWGRGGSRWTSFESARPGKSLPSSCLTSGRTSGCFFTNKSLPPSIYISSFNLNRLSYSLGSSIHVCLDSSHGPHFFTVPEQLEDQTCPLTLAIAIGQCTKASQVVRSFLFPCLFSSLLLKKKSRSFEPMPQTGFF